MTAAASKYTATAPAWLRNACGNTPGSRAATTLYPYATATPRPISVNMFRCRVTTERQPRTKNGHPPQSTTGVAKTSWTQVSSGCGTNPASGPPLGSISDMAMAKTGSVSTALTQNRRRMSVSSGFSSSSTVTVRGSSAMPQIGHEPGSLRTISGCIGQTYSVRVGAGAATSGSSIMPHLGHAPGDSCRTSGSMGQT